MHLSSQSSVQNSMQKPSESKIEKFLTYEIPNIGRALVGTGAAGAFAPVNFKQRVHAPVLKRVVEL